ncbi:hypothetical protein HZA98_03770 [Candidatus Woesearchaeota archaeon]|nr:hypothetical protein [Candidatus Woesearchaeota archaeon]
MVVQATPGLIILPAIAMGILLGIYELYLLKGDEAFQGSHWLKHGLHIFPLLIVASLASFNITFFMSLVGSSLPAWLQSEILIRIVIGLLIAIKVYTASAVVPGAAGRGLHESLIHVLIIGVLVAASPYLWPLIEPIAPTWLGGKGGVSTKK